jgi:predicted esterase
VTFPLRVLGVIGALALELVARETVAGSATGALVRTTSLTLRDDVLVPINLAKRKLRFKASTKRDIAPSKVVAPLPGSPADPMLTGATLVVQGTGGTTDRVQVDLPATGWTKLGSDADPKGFKYQDTTRGAPVSKVIVKADLITVRGGGAAFGYSLDETQQGRIGVRLSFGETAWCADAPAKASGSPPSTARTDLAGKFTAQPKTAAPVSCPVGAPAFALAVTNGYGSGTYPAGSTVHVWAAVQPQDQLVTGWTGDAALLADPAEWHSTLLMPSRDAAVSATIVDRPTTLTVSTFTGTTAQVKTIRSQIPASPRGLVLFLHGTGGSNRFIASTEALYVALRVLESGYGVLGTEAEEAVAGDLDGDGKERWDAALTPTNVDFGNLNALVSSLRAAGTIGPTTPLFAIGMSNGGSMAVSLGAIGASAVAALYPELRFRAVVSHCADARVGAVAATTTPTGWLLCGHDDNDSVDNAAAIANSATLTSRGVPTFADLHPASPLYDERFTREAAVSLVTSQALAAELRAAGFVSGGGFFTTPTNAIIAAVTANPALLPTFVGLAPGLRNDVIDQVRATQAEHQMFSDWAERAAAFFDAHNS